MAQKAQKKEIKQKEIKKEDISQKNNTKKDVVKHKNTGKVLAALDKIDHNRKVIYAFITGILLTILVVVIIWPDRIASLKDGTQPVASFGDTIITADDLYGTMKDYYSVSLLLEKIDHTILSKKYPSTDEMEKELTETAQYYFDYYKNYYNYTQEQFLSQNNFANYDAFINYLRLDYRRNKYSEDYIKSLVTEEETQKYYEDKVYGDISTKHILVEVKSDATEKEKEDALKLAKEIIAKLDSGKTFDEVKKEYANSTTYEDLGFKAYNASLEENYLKEMQSLKDNTYSKKPVETSYGYHIVYRVEQKEKASFKDIKDTMIEEIAKEKTAADKNLYYNALIKMRNDADLAFTDTVMKSKYEKYCETYKN